MSCPSCGAQVDPAMRFCGQCGSRLEPEARITAERRQLSVMFCDLAASTELSARLDPEDLREVLRDYQDAATRAVVAYGGTVAEYLGDGLVVYFGYPQAHEDDAERAARAGLQIIQYMRQVNDQLQPRIGVRLGVRIGIHTGLVVVGEVGARDVRDVVRIVGETPNIAARVQGEAPVDGVVLTQDTRDLLGGRLVLEALGSRSLKGIPAPVELFLLVGVSSALRPRAASEIEMVDRVQARATLAATWHRVCAGHAEAVLLTGQAGIGKSKLLDAFRLQVEAEGGCWLEASCSPYLGTSALHPFVPLLGGLLSVPEHVSSQVRRHALESALRALGQSADLPLLAVVLGVPLPGPPQHLGTAPAVARQATAEGVLRTLRRVCGGRSGVLIVEDAHWADPSTGELIERLLDDPLPGLLSLVTRRDAVPTAATRLRLEPLEQADVEVLVERVAGAPIRDDLRTQIAARADGVPLFAGELVRMLLDSGAAQDSATQDLDRVLDLASIPTRLQDSLMARIDRLGPAKELAQLAATIGRTFSYDLLAEVASCSPQDLLLHVDSLVSSQLVTRDADGVSCTFTHALLRDVAYGSLLHATRRHHHARIGRALVTRFPAVAAAQPELVARHFTEAQESADAVTHWRAASRAAVLRSATAEALSHLRHARALLPQVADSPDRAEVELAVHAALGAALAAVKGYGDPEVASAYQRADELARTMPSSPELFPVLFGLVAYFTSQARFADARTAGEQLLATAEELCDSGLRIEAEFSLGMVDLYTGNPAAAADRLDHALRLYDPGEHHQLAYRYVFDPGVACHRSVALLRCLTGRADEALEPAQAAVALAQQLQHPFSLASALVFSAMVHQLRGEREQTAEIAAQAAELATAQGFPFWRIAADVLRGWAGQGDARTEQARNAISSWRASGTVLLLPYWLTLLAEAELEQGDPASARTTLAQAMEQARRTGETCWAAELTRVAARVERSAHP